MRSRLELTPDRLRAETEALRGLARALVRDPWDAEDACQDAWLALLQAPRSLRRAASLGPWLLRVTANFARRIARAGRRQARREHRAARPEALPASADTLARIEVLGRVADAVVALPEPYRTTVVLRFWDGLPPRHIARCMGAPVATVRSRLRRALVLLRTELDRRMDGRDAWSAPLAASCGSSGTLAVALVAWIGVVFMKKSLLVGAALLVVSWSLWSVWPEAAVGSVPADGGQPVAAAERGSPPSAARESTGQRTPVAMPEAPASAASVDPDQIAGILVDPDGGPVAGQELLLRSGKGGMTDLERWPRTGRDGRFTVRRATEDQGPVRFQLQSDQPLEAVDWPRSVPWGTVDLRLMVRRLPAIELLVVAADTGRPVERFALKCAAKGGSGVVSSPTEALARNAGHHEGGRVLLARFRGGENLLVVLPEDPSLLPNVPVRFDTTADPMPTRLRIELPRRAELPVVVESSAHVPIAGCRVELVQGAEMLTQLGRSALSWDMMGNVLSTGELGWRHGEATTDAQGRATLAAPPDAAPLTIRVCGPHCVPRVMHGVRMGGPESPLRIQVVVGATLRGRVVPASVLHALTSGPLRPGLRIALRDDSVELPYGAGVFPVAEDGSFRVEGIPPGDCRVLLHWQESRVLRPNHTQQWGADRVLGTLALADGEVREATLDATALVPVRIRGRASVNGAPLRAGNLWFAWRVPGAREAVEGESDERGFRGGGSWVRTDADGRYEAAVPTGDLRPMVDLGDNRHLVGSWITLVPGVDRELDLEFEHRVARVRVLDAEGRRPVAGRLFNVRNDCGAPLPGATSDAEGVVVLDPAPPCRFRLYTLPPELDAPERLRAAADANGGTLRGLYLVLDWLERPGDGTAEFTVRMPRTR